MVGGLGHPTGEAHPEIEGTDTFRRFLPMT
jgi:hypothetical protein